MSIRMRTRRRGVLVAAVVLLSGASLLTAAPASAARTNETEPNDLFVNADPLWGGRSGNGGITPVGDYDAWKSTVAVGDLVFAYVDTSTSDDSLDSMLDVLDNTATSIEVDDDDGPATSSVVAGAVAPVAGNVLFDVNEFADNATIVDFALITLGYELWQTVVGPGMASAESEPNGTTATADPITTRMVTAAGGAPDVDLFSFPAKAGDQLVVIMDDDPEDQGGAGATNFDSELDILDTDGTTVLAAGDDNSGSDGNAAGAVAAPTTGTYFVRVGDGTFGGDTTYRFTVLVNGTPFGPDRTFAVNATADLVDVRPGDGVCADVTGNCSLRAAVMEANAEISSDTITVPTGTYNLTIPSVAPDGDDTGDLDVLQDLTITGTDSGTTIVNGTGINPDRLIEVGGKLGLSKMTLTGATGTGAALGGAIRVNVSGEATISDSTVSGNTLGLGVRAAVGNAGATTLINSTVSGNTGTSTGGGVASLGVASTLAVINSTISGNTANHGAGVYVAGGGTASIANSTITANTATTAGGGVRATGGSAVTVGRSIVAGNTAPTGPDCAPAGGAAFVTGGYNLIGNGTGCTFPGGGAGDQVGTAGSPIDPRLGPLQDNGSPDTHALLQGSTAINAVPVASCPLGTDQRGVARPQGAACDIGAYEAQPATAVGESYSTPFRTTLTVAAPGVLGNDTDPEGDALAVSNPAGVTAANGTVTMAADGSFTYVPNSAFSGMDSLTYAAADATGASNLATVTIAVGRAADTVGLVDPGRGIWNLRNGAGTVTSFFYGNPGDTPFMGDWDCDGDDTPGLFRTSDAFAYLRNSNDQGIADIRFFFGNPSDVPLAGDFDGDGCDTLSIYRPSEQRFYVVNKLGANEGGLGPADFSFLFGNPGDKPVVGDWDDDGIDEVGLHRESTGFFYWRNTLDTGIASGEIFFGDPGDRFVAGDWGTVDGTDTPAVFRPSNQTVFFRHTLTEGIADSSFVWAGAGTTWLPVAGFFGLD